MSHPLTVELSIPSLPEFVGVVRLAASGVASRLGFTVDEIEDIKLSVSEACTNAIQHAYGSTPCTKNDIIAVTLTISDRTLSITVKDFGSGFDLSILGTEEQKKRSEERMGLGLGLTFIKSLMDDTAFSSKIGQGTTIEMKKTVLEPQAINA